MEHMLPELLVLKIILSGIVGVAPNVKLVAIRVLDANGYGYYSTILSSFNYIITWKKIIQLKKLLLICH